MRDTYRKALKKNVTKSGQSAKKIKMYKYSNQLEFLNKYFGERTTKRNIESQEEEDDDHEDESELCKEPENILKNIQNF